MTSSPTWMADTPAIHQSPLRNICLPASHDSATNALQDFMSAQYGVWVGDVINLVKDLGEALDEIPWLNRLINPVAWVMGAATPAVKGLATATSRSILQQLYDGIRCLDLRVCYFAGDHQFYTYHGLLGTNIKDVLADIKTFMQATDGEIVYVTMGHWAGFETSDLYTTFASQVEAALGTWACKPAYDTGGAIQNNVLEQTYTAIVGTPATSRVILVVGPANGATPPPLEGTIFWPPAYSPPDNGPEEKNPAAGSVIAGYYTKTTDLDTMLSAQQDQQQNAAGLPFALYMTLTPSVADYGEVVVSALASTIARLAVVALAIPFIGFTLFVAIECVAAALAIGELAFSWRTLQQLCAPLDAQLTELVYKNFVKPGEPSNISFLYVDYYESTHVVALAVGLSLANAKDSVPQLPVVPINQYSSTMNGVTRYAFGTSMGYGWALVEAGVFRAYSDAAGAFSEESGEPIAVNMYYQNNGAWNMVLSTSATAPAGFPNSNGPAFYAFAAPAPWLIPIYQYSQPYPNPTFTTFYFYSPSAQVQGWGPPNPAAPVFYAFTPSAQPVYALQTSTSGQTRYSWSMQSTGGTGWSPGSVVFRIPTVQVAGSVPLTQYYQIINGAWNFMLSIGPPPPSFAVSTPFNYAFEKRGPGLAAIYEFTKEIAGFGTVYQYRPVPRIDGWKTGKIAFYAALPHPPGMPTSDLEVIDLGALAGAAPPSSDT
jgi:hypothetical protein